MAWIRTLERVRFVGGALEGDKGFACMTALLSMERRAHASYPVGIEVATALHGQLRLD